jgi:hypothetical protein
VITSYVGLGKHIQEQSWPLASYRTCTSLFPGEKRSENKWEQTACHKKAYIHQVFKGSNPLCIHFISTSCIQLLHAQGSVPYNCKYSVVPCFSKWSHCLGLSYITINVDTCWDLQVCVLSATSGWKTPKLSQSDVFNIKKIPVLVTTAGSCHREILLTLIQFY